MELGKKQMQIKGPNIWVQIPNNMKKLFFQIIQKIVQRIATKYIFNLVR